MKWRKIFLSRDQILDGTQMRIVFQASDIFKKAGGPADAALFTSTVPNAKHGVELYFSPGATALAEALIDKHGGVACDPPMAENVSLSAGKHRVFDLMK
ncbi:MAG TPA: hypothetical protein VLO07_02520 [Thermoanaerobaculia bacterium]|nr:hypothetical protein [Thermoanaerobaculia bacterium]